MVSNVPSWQAARNGLPGNLDTVNDPNQVNQFLGAHPVTPLYQGAQLVTPVGGANFTWLSYGNGTDLDQPFTMPSGHTTIGRVTLPVQPVGNGANLLVTLYPDNSGSPNTASPLAQSYIPAAWINQLTAPSGLPSAGALATADASTLYAAGGLATTTWVPASGGGGFLNSAAFTQSGNYGIFAGGYDGTTYYGTTYTVQWGGGSSLSLPIAQPSIPTGVENPTVCTTSSAVIVAGGIVTSTAPGVTTNVWVGSWNPDTGQIGSWSQQAALPVALDASGSATWNNTVYVVGGINGSNANVNTVYFATLNNGQIQSWTAGQALPVSVSNPFVGVLGDWLIVAGGNLTAISVSGSTGVYYAPILSDGSLGSWITGPSLPVAVYAQQTSGWNQPLVPDAMVIVNGSNSVGSGESPQMMVLSYSPSTGALAKTWVQSQWPTASSFNKATAAFANGDGSYATFNISPRDQYYEYSTLTPVPTISVPLYATGLTAGGTYHVVLQQYQAADASDYLEYGVNSAALSADALRSARYGGSWATALSGYSVPMTVYDNTPGGPVLHVWSDAGAATTTQVYNSLSLLTGVCEQTSMPNNPLDENPTFTSGVSPWTAVNGALSQSSAQTQGGFVFSGLLTPTGGFAQAYALSELIRIDAGSNQVTAGAAWFKPNGWFYSPTGWANFSLSLNWYDPNQGYLSTSSATVSLAANTWTQVFNYFVAPAGALYVAIAPTESGTPGASNLLYMSNVTVTLSPERVGALASVAQITYPSGASWPPTGVTQLA